MEAQTATRAAPMRTQARHSADDKIANEIANEVAGQAAEGPSRRFADSVPPQGEILGRSLPDPRPAWNAGRKHGEFGPIDRAEFQAGRAGEGPCNRRPVPRTAAHEDGPWMRSVAQPHSTQPYFTQTLITQPHAARTHAAQQHHRDTAPDARPREVGQP